jgi:hypothetical protein
MKKIVIVIVILGFIVSGYFLFTKFIQKENIVCEEGFRFAPSSQTCEPVTIENSKIDITQIPFEIPGEDKVVDLKPDSQAGIYSATFKVSSMTEAEGFVSVKESDIVIYENNLIIVPFFVNSGGTGQFLYVGLFDTKHKKHLSSVFIGDRIRIDSLELKNSRIHVLFKTRLSSESFMVEPSIPSEVVLEVQDGLLNEIIRLENARFEDVELKDLPISSQNGNLIIKGAIPGNWYFEAIAPYRIFDNEYNQIALGTLQALSDWMTTQRVPFEINVGTSNLNYTGKAVLIIESSNMQGDEEGERKVKRMYIPITI